MRRMIVVVMLVVAAGCGKSTPAATPSPTAVPATPTPVVTAAPTPVPTAATSGGSTRAPTAKPATQRPMGAKCKDGTYDYGTSSHTACAGHGGVGTSY